MLVVRVPTTFAKAHLEGRFIDLIRSILAEITGSPVEVRFVVAKDDQSTNGNDGPSSAGKRSYRAPKGRGQGQAQPHAEGPTWPATFEPPMALHSTGVDAHPVAHSSTNASERMAGEYQELYGQHSSNTQPGLLPFGGAGLLNNRYTFSTFIVGKSNQLAHAASLAVS